MKRIFFTTITAIILTTGFSQNVLVSDDNTATPGTAVTDGLFQLRKTGYSLIDIHNYSALAADVNTELAFKTGAGTVYYTGIIKSVGINATTARLSFFTGTNTTRSNLLERMTILNNGNVGIGTTAPDARLDIADNGYTGTTLARITTDDGGPWSLILRQTTASQNWGIYINNDDNLHIYDITDSRYVMSLSGDGYVGIGTANPLYKLHVLNNSPGAPVGWFENTNTDTWNSAAVYGKCNSTDDIGYGGTFIGGRVGVQGSVSPTGSATYYGVYGNCQGGTGTNYGVYGLANSSAGIGVQGYSSYLAASWPNEGTGVKGEGGSYGGYFLGDQTTIASVGVYASGKTAGVYGLASTASGGVNGVYGKNSGTNHDGCVGCGSGAGVRGDDLDVSSYGELGTANYGVDASYGSAFAGLAASAALGGFAGYFRVNDAITNAVTDVVAINHFTSGISTAGIGTGILIRSQDAAGNTENTAGIQGIMTNVTNGLEAGDLLFLTRTGGAAITERMRINGAGNVGIGTAPSSYRLDVRSSAATAILGRTDYNTSGTQWGGTNGMYAGVMGFGGPGTSQYHAGVYGYMLGTGDNSGGVVGAYNSLNWGALGYDYGANVASVYGQATNAAGTNIAGYFTSSGAATTNYAVYGTASGATTNYAGYFLGGTGTGVYGKGKLYGGYFTTDNNNTNNYALYGIANGAGGDANYGIYGEGLNMTDNYGIYGKGTGNGGATTAYGVYGIAVNGNNNYGVYGATSGGTNNYAGYFAGNVCIEQNAVLANFQNGSGAALATGDVVVVNTAADVSVTTTTTVGNRQVLGAVVVGGAAGTTVKVAIGGIFTIKVTGATNRGDYLRTSTTAGSAVSNGTTAAAGNFAIALTATVGAGTVKAMFLKAENY